MLQVFLVDTGSMLTLDMDLAFQTVAQLKEVIERANKIPIDKQVLLVNGGESLESVALVYTYSAGTDTNPIFLFSKNTIECDQPPTQNLDFESDGDLAKNLEKALALPPLYETLVTRCQLAQQFHEIANDEIQACERLVHEQHLQQQGWAAAIANLDDVYSSFKSGAEMCLHNFEAYLGRRDEYAQLLNHFSSDLELLRRIPVLKPLLQSCKEQEEPLVPDQPSVTLHEWIKSQDHKRLLEVLFEKCRWGLERFEINEFKYLKGEITKILMVVEDTNMREIPGLEERLYGLDKMMSEVRKIVIHQAETAQAFLQNKMRVKNIGDMSILPDLCTSHKDQLKLMQKNHQQLRDLHWRFFRAKKELSSCLHSRLRWMLDVEKSLIGAGGTVLMYHGNLRRIRRLMDIVQQVHSAPNLYLWSVVEVVRRRAFTKEFLKWSKVLSRQAMELHNKEMLIRREFTSRLKSHFLYNLFPGMHDSLPPFALETPEEFDRELPDIQPAHIAMLKTLFPGMVVSLNLPEVATMPDAALVLLTPAPICNLNQDPTELHPSLPVDPTSNAEPVAGRECYLSAMTSLQSVIATGPKIELVPGDPLLESPRDESEPDTEEFEKVDGGVAANYAGEAAREDESSQRQQHIHYLEDRLSRLQEFDNEAVLVLRAEIMEARQTVLKTKEDFEKYLAMVSSQITNVISSVQRQIDSDKDAAVREMLAKAKLDHQAAVDRVDQQLQIELQKLHDAHNEIQKSEEKLQRSNALVEMGKQEAEARLNTQKLLLLEDHHETIKKMTLEHELELVGFKEEYQKECNSLESALQEAQQSLSNKTIELDALKHAQSLAEDRFSKRLQEEMESLKARLQEDFSKQEQASVAKYQGEAKQSYEEEIKRLRERNKDLSDVCHQREEQLSCLTKEAEQRLTELKESLSKEHKREIEVLRNRSRLVYSTAGMERSPSDCSLEKIERPDSADPSRIEQQVSHLKAELEEKEATICEMLIRHQKEMEDLVEQGKKARCESMKFMRVSLTAEKQVAFNEAVNRATSEKEATIQDLQRQLKASREELQDERLLNARIKAKEESFSFSLTSERSESSPVLSRPDSGNFHMVSPVTPRRSESSGLIDASASGGVSPSLEQPPETETNSLEISKSGGILEASVFVTTAAEHHEAMGVSLTASAAISSPPDKVSVYTCNVGDLVILLYDEKRQNYVVFMASSTYHFLHHDCHEQLSLGTSVIGEKCNWLLAEITNKEYCQAKKEPNRFRVPAGTRFYRVHAKPVPQSPLRRSVSSSKKKGNAHP